MKKKLAFCLSALLLAACSGDKAPAAGDVPPVPGPEQASAPAQAAGQQAAAAPRQAKKQAAKKAKPAPAETQERIRAAERVLHSETTVS